MQIYITDCTGRRFWNTDVAAAFASGERRNFARRLAAIQSGVRGFEFVDAASARVVEELSAYDAPHDMTDEELLAALGVDVDGGARQ